MANVAMMGWDADAKVWRKVVVNSAGKLIIDPSEILEDDPTDGEVGKAPTSNWAHDHAALPAVHHARYTDAESRAAIGDLLDSSGVLIKSFNCNYYDLSLLQRFQLKYSVASTRYVYISTLLNQGVMAITARTSGGGLVPCFIQVHNGTAYQVVATEPVVDTKIATHAAIAAAHHARYTDAEAVAAVGYGGTKYWSCSGVHFGGQNPDVNAILRSAAGYLQIVTGPFNLVAHVSLPHGAVVTSAKVTGNAASETKTWALCRLRLSDVDWASLAVANINTADTSIDVATIDNSLYGYYLRVIDVATADRIYGATITYTL